MQVRRGLSMGQEAKGLGTYATKHRSGMQTGTEEPKVPAAAPSAAAARLLSMKARYEQWTGENEEVLGFLRQPPDDQTAEPLGELYFRLTQLTREVEYLHGMRGQEPAPWLLLCRDSDLLNTDGYMPTDRQTTTRCT